MRITVITVASRIHPLLVSDERLHRQSEGPRLGEINWADTLTPRKNDSPGNNMGDTHIEAAPRSYVALRGLNDHLGVIFVNLPSHPLRFGVKNTIPSPRDDVRSMTITQL